MAQELNINALSSYQTGKNFTENQSLGLMDMLGQGGLKIDFNRMLLAKDQVENPVRSYLISAIKNGCSENKNHS